MNVSGAGTISRSTPAMILALSAFAAVGACSIIAIELAAYPGRTEAWLHAARYTARFSFAIFLVVFVVRPWNDFWPSGATQWALTHRRALGLAFATAHFIHLYALARFRLASGQPPSLGQFVAGGAAYLLLAAMTATSNDASVRALGSRNWKRLHTAGIYWIWFIFFVSYGGRVAAGQHFFVPFVLLALAVLALRIAARRRRSP